MALKTLTRRMPDRARESMAAVALDLGREADRTYLQQILINTRTQARQSWDWYDKLGTIHKAISRSARIAGYAKLRCVQVNPDNTDGDTVSTGLPAQIVEGIYSPWGGVRGLIMRWFSLMKVPADSLLIRCRDGADEDGYQFLSSSEIDSNATDVAFVQAGEPLSWSGVPTSGGNSELLQHRVQGSDVLGRVWVPGIRWVDVPDSSLAALSTECEVLHTLTLSLKGRIRSRFAMSGLMYLPSEIQEVVLAGQGKRTMDILDYISKAMKSNVQNYESSEVTLPILLRGPGINGEQIRHITIDRDLLAADLELRQQLIDEILFGLDVQTGATKGTENANHWGAWAMSDEEIRIAVQPDLDTLAWALTRLVLHPQLEDGGIRPEQIMRYRVAWDISESAVRTNKQEDTRQAHDLGVASKDAVARVTGLTEADRMSEAEEIRWAGRVGKNIRLMGSTWKTWAEVDWDEVLKFSGGKAPGPAKDSPTEDSSVGPGVGDPGSPGGGDADKDERPE